VTCHVTAMSHAPLLLKKKKKKKFKRKEI